MDWGSRVANIRGQILLEILSELDMVLATIECVQRQKARPRWREIVWQESGYHTHSDHQIIFLNIRKVGGDNRMSNRNEKTKIAEASEEGTFRHETNSVGKNEPDISAAN